MVNLATLHLAPTRALLNWVAFYKWQTSRIPTVDGINQATPCDKQSGLARHLFFYCFLPASRSRDQSHAICYENPRYSDVIYASGAPTWALGQFVFDVQKLRNLLGHQIFANPEFQSKRKSRAMLFEAGYTKYQPEMIFLDLFHPKK